jgi:predicted esterase
MKRQIAVLILLLTATHSRAGAADDPPASFDGEWRTSIGTLTLTQKGSDVTGTYGNVGQFRLKGTVKGNVLTIEYQEGAAKGNARFTLDETGNAFTGGFQIQGGRAGMWSGWRPDPKALVGETGKFAGTWLTDLGLMELTQEGKNVKGRYAIRGTSELEGTANGRHLEFKFQGLRGGRGWFDLNSAGKNLAGAANNDGFPGWYAWNGRSAPEYQRHAKLVAGKIVDGSTRNLLTYAARAPESFREGDPKKWPTVLILHGSNMNARDYVNTIAAVWPDVARDFLLIGINGETPSESGPTPRFNYTYVNYVGRSTFRGFPGTDRESPALVREAMDELKGVYPIDHYLVGGHSQGGFLTYSLLMNSPDLVAGAFPTSAGVIFQCEPDAYADEALRKAQRNVPLAVIHSKADPMVSFSMGEYAANLFGESGWPGLRFFADDTAGHNFSALPVAAAIRWLESLAARDSKALLDFAEARENEGAHRDAIAALVRARTLKLDAAQTARAETLARAIDSKAASAAKDLLARIKADQDSSWVDAFRAYRDDFEFADGAKEVMTAFRAVRSKHAVPAKLALDEARAAFQQGKRDEGYAKYQEIVDKYYAAPVYRIVKGWLAERK